MVLLIKYCLISELKEFRNFVISYRVFEISKIWKYDIDGWIYNLTGIVSIIKVKHQNLQGKACSVSKFS